MKDHFVMSCDALSADESFVDDEKPIEVVSPASTPEIEPLKDGTDEVADEEKSSVFGPEGCLEDYDILKVLGKGAYGKVFQVRKIRGVGRGNIYAMKAMNKSRICNSKTDLRHTKAERDVLASVQHPFIVHLHFAFETRRRLYLVQEFCTGGELFRRMEFERMLMEDAAKFYLGEIVIALEYLHKKDVIYRDLKTENVMLDRSGHVKLIDFGLSKTHVSGTNLAHTFCGTVEYMAPEVILRAGGYGKPADWWSLGIFTFDLLTGRSPFHSNQGKQATKERILKARFPMPKILTPQAQDFVRRLLRKNVEKRLGTGGAKEVKSHHFFNDTDWHRVERKEYQPPFVPTVDSDTDVQNFDEQFTNKSPRQSEETMPDNASGYARLFDDFDYVSEETLEEEHNNRAEQHHLNCVNNNKGAKHEERDLPNGMVELRICHCGHGS